MHLLKQKLLPSLQQQQQQQQQRKKNKFDNKPRR